MNILRNPNTNDSFLFQNGEELLKINLLLKQIAYFKKGTAFSEIVFLSDWVAIDENEMSESVVLMNTKRLLKHLQVDINGGVTLFNCTDDPNCFLIIGSGKIIQVDKRFSSLSDEGDSLFLKHRYNFSRPESNTGDSLNLYHEILKSQSKCIFGFTVGEKSVY